MRSLSSGFGLKSLKKTVDRSRKQFIKNYLSASDSSALSSVAAANQLVSTLNYSNLLSSALGPHSRLWLDPRHHEWHPCSARREVLVAFRQGWCLQQSHPEVYVLLQEHLLTQHQREQSHVRHWSNEVWQVLLAETQHADVHKFRCSSTSRVPLWL